MPGIGLRVKRCAFVGACALLGLAGALAACGQPALPQTNIAPVLAAPASTAAAEIVKLPPSDDIASFSDEFDDASSLASWRDHSTVEGWPSQVDQLDVDTTTPGALHLVPLTSAWFADFRGVFLFKEITGDFIVTTRIKATGKQSDVPTRDYSFAGLMVRAPRDVTMETWQPNAENWLFITTGYGERAQGKPQLEVKTTRNSASELRLLPSRTGWVELRVVRVGSRFVTLSRFEGEEWTIRARYQRADLPETVQVGLNAYTDWQAVHIDAAEFNRTLLKGGDTNPDLIVSSDYVRFRRPEVPDALRARMESTSITAQPNAEEWLTIAGGD